MQRDFGAQADGESDELKRVLLEGNPYFLGITFFVSILHSVFDMLAFKNDIGFWKGKKNVEGLSVRTVGINCVCQVRIVLLPTRAHISQLQHQSVDLPDGQQPFPLKEEGALRMVLSGHHVL